MRRRRCGEVKNSHPELLNGLFFYRVIKNSHGSNQHSLKSNSLRLIRFKLTINNSGEHNLTAPQDTSYPRIDLFTFNRRSVSFMTCIALWDRSCYCENKHLLFFFLQNLPCKCSFSCFHLVFPCLKPIKIQNTANRNTVCCCLHLSHTPKCADTQFGLSVQHLLGGCDL